MRIDVARAECTQGGPGGDRTGSVWYIVQCDVAFDWKKPDWLSLEEREREKEKSPQLFLADFSD